MDFQLHLFISGIIQTEIPKRHVSYNYIKAVILKFRFFKSFNLDTGWRVELLCNPSAYGINLHAIKLGFLHTFRKTMKKVSNPHSRFQNFSLLESKLLQGFINTPHDFRRRIKRTVDTGPCLGVFFCGQQFLQFLIFFFPLRAFTVKSIWQPAPPYIPRKNFLFFFCGVSLFLLQCF